MGADLSVAGVLLLLQLEEVMGRGRHSDLSYLDNVAPLCVISSKLRVGIDTPIFSCG